MKKDLLKSITDKTRELWDQLNDKIGDVYRLCVNGLGEVLLTRGYTEVVASGNRNIQKFIKSLLG